MNAVLLRVSMFFIGGTFIATVVSGSILPLFLGVLASYVLFKVMGDPGDGGGGGGGCGGNNQNQHKRRRC